MNDYEYNDQQEDLACLNEPVFDIDSSIYYELDLHYAQGE